MSSGRSKVIIGFAAVLGLVVAGVVWNTTSRLQSQVQVAVQQARSQLVPVAVAAVDIPVRTKITPDMVKIVQMPAEAKHPEAVNSETLVDGKITRLPVTAGEQLLTTKFLGDREESGLTYVIPPSKRAVAVGINEVIGSGGNIVPGDRVDVIAVFDARTAGKDMAVTILQNIEVLAVAQDVQGEQPEQDSPLDSIQKVGSAPLGSQSNDKNAFTPVKQAPQPKPQAKSVTLAVSPEEAQRLVLAEEKGKIRLIMRPFKENTSSTLPEATLGTIAQPLVGNEAQITGVNITPSNAKVGDTVRVEITVKNTSNAPIKTQGPNPEFTYVQGQTYFSQGFASEDKAFRVGINFGENQSVNFPYRWGLGGDLPPGASTTVVGYIKLSHEMPASNVWAGLIYEPAGIVQDNVGTTPLTITGSDTAVITVDKAEVRSAPSIDSGVIAEVLVGTELPIIGQQNDWYKVRLNDGREGYVAAGWISAARGS